MIDNSLEKVILSAGCLCTHVKGTSMNPMLYENKHKVYIERNNDRLKVGDVALYKRLSGEYVLHRVMKVNNESYVFCGDNHFVLERGILDNQILGVLKGYYENDKFIDLDKSFKYKVYKTFWGKSLACRRVLNFFRKIKNKLFGKKS